MANNPEVQGKVQDELDRVCGSWEPTTDDRELLPYTEATILEIMRIRAIFQNVLFHRTSKDQTLGGYFFPKGKFCIMPQIHLHHNEKVFPLSNSEKFDPEHFFKNCKFESHPQVILFGTGKKRCLGEALAKVSTFVYFTSTQAEAGIWGQEAKRRHGLRPDYRDLPL